MQPAQPMHRKHSVILPCFASFEQKKKKAMYWLDQLTLLITVSNNKKI